MKYKEETYARKLYAELQAKFNKKQNVLSKISGLFKKGNSNSSINVSIEGAGVHWKCIVTLGGSQCDINCFNYDFAGSKIKGPEYYTYFKLNDVVMATGRTQDKQKTIEAVAYWCNNKSLEFLYEQFEFIDREWRALERMQAEFVEFYPELTNASRNDIIEGHFYTYHLLFSHNARSCEVYCAGYKSEPVYKFKWDDTLIFKTSVHDIARMGLLIKQWVIDAEKPSELAAVFTEIDFGKLAEYYEKGNPLEGEFIIGWNSLEDFYNDINLEQKREIIQLIKTMRKEGFDKTLRAGTSLYSMILSRSRRYGLRNEQPCLIFSFNFIQSAMEVRTWKGEVLTFSSIAYNATIEKLLKALELEPVD